MQTLETVEILTAFCGRREKAQMNLILVRYTVEVLWGEGGKHCRITLLKDGVTVGTSAEVEANIEVCQLILSEMIRDQIVPGTEKSVSDAERAGLEIQLNAAFRERAEAAAREEENPTHHVSPWYMPQRYR